MTRDRGPLEMFPVEMWRDEPGVIPHWLEMDVREKERLLQMLLDAPWPPSVDTGRAWFAEEGHRQRQWAYGLTHLKPQETVREYLARIDVLPKVADAILARRKRASDAIAAYWRRDAEEAQGKSA